ncbi:MAG: DUF1501 domain-containing protein [Verrucomicrobiae bacterium]|nr:DUF1501 domain-containing protein [Verrucomicrobiae bacterium]
MNHSQLTSDTPTGKLPFSSRRQFLAGLAGTFPGLALTDLLARDGVLSSTLHHPPKAKRVVQLFMAGAASHVDLFDYKPQLEKEHGQQWDPGETVELFQSSPGASMKSVWDFSRYGRCGKAVSEAVAPLGEVVDDIAFVHNVLGKTGVHSQGTLLQTTGFNRPGFPSAGSWVSYALGSENDNLPGFVVLPDHRGLASNGTKNWSSMFLPAEHQGTVIRPGAETPIDDLFPPKDSRYITPSSDRAGRDLLTSLNSKYAEERPGDSRLQARIRSYELAAKMQLSATEALNVSKEPQYIKDLYGLAPEGPGVDDTEINAKAETEFFGRKCLIARRLLERGVRFVQIWSGNDNGFPRRNWDSHEDIKRDHGPLARGMAVGAAGLIKDLKQRGMLDDTIILWTTEFGRMPCAQRGVGRDHNPFVFTNWLCGGGIQGGVTHGESDQWGFKPLDPAKPTEVYDIHATILHQLGIDHEQLTVRHDSIDRRLTDVHGHVIREILA